MTDLMLVSLVFLALALLGGFEIHSLRGALRNNERSGPLTHPIPTGPTPDDLAQAIAANAAQIDQLRLAVSDGIERTDRAEKRIQKTVASARRLVSENGLEHAGIEAEAAEILARDDGPSEVVPVHEVSADVVPDGPSGVPGLSRAQLEDLKEAISA